MSHNVVLKLSDFGNVVDYVLDQPRAYVVGRARDCDIVIPDDYWHGDVSRHHCEIEVDPPLVRVRDLHSTNGTLVNGHLIGAKAVVQGKTETAAEEPLELTHGDEIVVGSVNLCVQVTADAETEEFADRSLAFPPVA